MKSKHKLFIFVNLVLFFYISYRYDIFSCVGILMIVTTHELGHYICAVIKGRDPEFVSSGANVGVKYSGEYSFLITAGGMIVNFLFLPLFVGMGVMDMGPVWIALLIIGGSLRDIVNIVKMVRGLRKNE